MRVSDIFLIGFTMDYELAVLVIALYGHAGLCYMTCEAQAIV